MFTGIVVIAIGVVILISSCLKAGIREGVRMTKEQFRDKFD